MPKFTHTGFSIIEVLLAVGILSITTAAAISFFGYQMKSNIQMQSMQTRDLIVRQIQNNLSSEKAILTSKENQLNLAYKYCLEGRLLKDGTLDQTACQNSSLSDKTRTPFALFSALGSGAITGGPNRPQTYTSAGDTCTPETPGCFIEASTWFVATCAGKAASCATADTIEFRYLVDKTKTADIIMKPATGFIADPSVLNASQGSTNGVSMIKLTGKTFKDMNLFSARTYCNRLKAACDDRLDGTSCDSTVYSGWRLPTADEANLYPKPPGIFATRSYVTVSVNAPQTTRPSAASYNSTSGGGIYTPGWCQVNACLNPDQVSIVCMR